MIEQYLQVAIEFLKEVWFQLDSRFGIGETQAFQFIKPYIFQLQDNPTYLGIAFASLALIPFGLYKIKSNVREQDRKLEELIDEMESEEVEEVEGYKVDDPRRLRRPDPTKLDTTETSEDEIVKDIQEEVDTTLSENKNQEQPTFSQILEKFDEEGKNDALHVNTQKVMGTFEDKFKLEPISSQLAEPDNNKDLIEFEELNFDSEDNIKEDSIQAGTSHEQANEDLPKESELISLDGELSQVEPFLNYSELRDEEQDRAIKKLQGEMESTINKLTERLEDDPGSPSSIEDLSLEEKNEEQLPKSEQEAVSMEQLDISEEPVIDNIESESLQPVPERNYSPDNKPNRKAESLINRLKFFQENLDTRSRHENKEDSFFSSEPINKNMLGEQGFVEKRDFESKSPRVTPEDNKKYMKALESFIFLKNQNKH
tara:strand:+ start:1283 stop:2566 length:1284 start_codon:yes stop_codon:yes gene_type:complete